MTNQTHTSARQPKKRSPMVVGGATIISFVALLYIVEAFDQLNGHRFDDNGIRPLETDGLWGILFAPLLHANWAHLAANTGPALVLGFLVTLAGLSRFVWATAIVWIVGGFGTWLIGNWGSSCGLETDHIGASGLIFGWLTFLLVFGFFIRSGWQIVIGLLVLVLYDGVLSGAGASSHPRCCRCSEGPLRGVCSAATSASLPSHPSRK